MLAKIRILVILNVKENLCFSSVIYLFIYLFGVHGAMGCGQKSLASIAVPSAPVRVPNQRSFAPSVASVWSVD